MTERWWPVTGQSMWPLGRGMAVQVDRFAGIERGDLIVFIAGSGAQVFAHRVHAIRPTSYLTRGDTNPTPDAAVPHSAVIGRVTAIRARGHVLHLDDVGFSARAQRWLGLGWSQIAPGLRRARRWSCLGSRPASTPPIEAK